MGDEWELIEKERLDRAPVARIAGLLPEGPAREWALGIAPDWTEPASGAADFWDRCPDPVWMLWVLKGFGLDEDLRLMRVACRWLRFTLDRKRDAKHPDPFGLTVYDALARAEAAFANERGGVLDDVRRVELGRQRRILSTLERSESHERKALDLILSPLFDWVAEDEAKDSANAILDASRRIQAARTVLHDTPADGSHDNRTKRLRAASDLCLAEIDLMNARRIAPDHGAYRRPDAIAEDVAKLCQWAMEDAGLATLEQTAAEQARALRRILGNPFA